MMTASVPSASDGQAEVQRWGTVEPVGGSVPAMIGATVGAVVGSGGRCSGRPGGRGGGFAVRCDGDGLGLCGGQGGVVVESTTFTVKLYVPWLVGVPVIAPVDGCHGQARRQRRRGHRPGERGGATVHAEHVRRIGLHSVPLGSGVQEIWTAPTMLVFQTLKVLQINVALEAG